MFLATLTQMSSSENSKTVIRVTLVPHTSVTVLRDDLVKVRT